MNNSQTCFDRKLTATVGGSYRKYWLEIQNLIMCLENDGINVIAPSKEWEPNIDENENVKFNGEENVPISDLEANFLYNMISSDIFIIHNPNSYVGYMAYAEFFLAYYIILNKTLESKLKREIINNLIKIKGQKFYDKYYDEYRNLLIGKDFINEIRNKRKKAKLRYIYFTEPPIGFNYFYSDGSLRENLINDFFSSPEFARDREYYQSGLISLSDEKLDCGKNSYNNSWTNFEWYLYFMQKRVKLIQDGIKRGIVFIGIDNLISKQITNKINK